MSPRTKHVAINFLCKNALVISTLSLLSIIALFLLVGPLETAIYSGLFIYGGLFAWLGILRDEDIVTWIGIGLAVLIVLALVVFG